jgi:hypothetical protein
LRRQKIVESFENWWELELLKNYTRLEFKMPAMGGISEKLGCGLRSRKVILPLVVYRSGQQEVNAAYL